MMVKLFSAAGTHVGLHRANNEDAYLEMPDKGVFALSDGMGGAAAGEVASAYFIETVGDLFVNHHFSPGFNPQDEDIALVQNAFTLSNQRILEHATQNPEDWGMGCTGEVLVFSGNQYTIGHVGDSRIYLFRDGNLQQLTKDHSLVQQWVDQGVMSSEDARHHPKKNVILQAIGTESTVSPDILRGEAHDQDVFMLCSDGLTDLVEDDAIRRALASRESLQDKADDLIKAALAEGGKDNVTVVLCELEMD
jgi:protein phosphatase